jgi:hypothetical protein
MDEDNKEIFKRKDIYEAPLWRIGPDGKYYCTPEGLERAAEEWLLEMKREILHGKIIRENRESLPIDEGRDETLTLSPNLLQALKALREIPGDQWIILVRFLVHFLISFPPPPTSSSEQK